MFYLKEGSADSLLCCLNFMEAQCRRQRPVRMQLHSWGKKRRRRKCERRRKKGRRKKWKRRRKREKEGNEVEEVGKEGKEEVEEEDSKCFLSLSQK